jgi:hypothetical protein
MTAPFLGHLPEAVEGALHPVLLGRSPICALLRAGGSDG